MTLTELKYIVAVAREKHFGHAAEACHVSQPTLSVAIKKLEEELEVKLYLLLTITLLGCAQKLLKKLKIQHTCLEIQLSTV